MSFLTEAAATLEYQPHTYDYSLPHSKTVDLIGEEFIKKEGDDAAVTAVSAVSTVSVSSAPSVSAPVSVSTVSRMSLPPLTYTTTTTIPTIATGQPQAQGGEEAGVLYCNLDDLSRYIPDNFSFDQMITDSVADNVPDNVSVQVLSLPHQLQHSQRLGQGSPMQIQVTRNISSYEVTAKIVGVTNERRNIAIWTIFSGQEQVICC